jgi:hypothetical protein
MTRMRGRLWVPQSRICVHESEQFSLRQSPRKPLLVSLDTGRGHILHPSIIWLRLDTDL